MKNKIRIIERLLEAFLDIDDDLLDEAIHIDSVQKLKMASYAKDDSFKIYFLSDAWGE